MNEFECDGLWFRSAAKARTKIELSSVVSTCCDEWGARMNSETCGFCLDLPKYSSDLIDEGGDEDVGGGGGGGVGG